MYRIIEKTKKGGSKISTIRSFSMVVEKLQGMKNEARVEKGGHVVGGVRWLDHKWYWSIENPEGE